jgi:serine protease Do
MTKKVKSILLPLAWAFFITIWFAGCSSGGRPKRETFVPLAKSVIDHVSQATFEVVVAKEINTSLIFDQDPMEDMPFQKKGDAYVSIGSAFLIGPNRFVSAAHVMQVDSPSLLSVLKLRDFDGKIYTPTQVTRFSNFRDLIEFQVDGPDDTRTPLTIAKEYTPGQTIFEVGNIDGDGLSYRSAPTLQSTAEPTEGKWKYIRYSSTSLGGATGGPLVNDQGQVVGVLIKSNQKDPISFGVPISELSTLALDHAEFYRKKIVFNTLPKAVEKDWIFSPPLPKNIEQLISEARASFSDLLKSTYAEIATDKDSAHFPKQKGFRSYTRNQRSGADLGSLVSDPYGSNWHLIEFKADHEKELKADQQLKDYRERGFIPVIVPLPASEKIAEFNEDPAKVATTMISNNSLGAFSKGGAHSYLMSVSKPDHVSILKDHLGRTWRASHWYYHDANFALSTTCTPVPSGSACIVRLGNYSSIAFEDDFMPQFLNQVMVSYQGTLAQWKNFLAAIDPKEIPEVLSSAQIDYLQGKSIELHVDHYAYSFLSSEIDGDSRLYLKMGYDPNRELGLVVLTANLFPGPEKEWLGIETRYIPTSDANEARASNWKKISKQQSPYDGVVELRKKSDVKTILKVVKKFPKTSTQVESVQVAICEAPEKRSDEELTKICDAFVRSLSER